ncbi:MAG: hemerythrin domain-containing protein [Kofleriaceae bacterium]|nr:hemerythrin domain-containing protein [Kofleriaceae bacterium]
MTIREYLSRDHARLDALLAQAVAAPQVDETSYTEFRAGLLRHIAMEEKVLFADARARNDDGVAQLIAVLHADHAAIASLLVPPPTHALIDTLQKVLAEHNPLEEDPDGLYERCDRAAGDGVQAVIARMEAIPAVRASRYLDEPRIYAHIERMLAARLTR